MNPSEPSGRALDSSNTVVIGRAPGGEAKAVLSETSGNTVIVGRLPEHGQSTVSAAMRQRAKGGTKAVIAGAVSTEAVPGARTPTVPVNTVPVSKAPVNKDTEAAGGGQAAFSVHPGMMSMPAQALIDELNEDEAIINQASPNNTVLQGRYRIVKLLGKGGFGAVYRVEDMRLPGKFWALKELVFRDKSQVEEAQRSFEREARMLSTLMHRSLPVIVDFFSEGQSTYLLMEEIEGQTLSQLVEAHGYVREIDALRWALELARVMDYLHNQNPPVIFRDIKPDNIMITNDGHIKLIDFGLARFFDPGKKRDTSVVGSVGYAPPEIWEDSMQTDARSDIYSFGATLYFILTGKPPSPVYGTHKIEPYRQDLSKGFVGLVLRCMATEPKDRYPNAAVIIRELMLLLSASAEAAPLLQEELRTESFARSLKASGQAEKVPSGEGKDSRHVAVASAQSSMEGGGSPGLISGCGRLLGPKLVSRTPAWSIILCLMATVLFLVGAVWGYQVRSKPLSFEYDTPYELVNPDKDEAKRLMEQKDYAGALSKLDSAIMRHPGDAEAHILRENVGLIMAGKENCIHIPAFMSLTGVDAPEAYRLLYGIAMATAEFNRAGGANGRMAMIDIFDDHSDLAEATKVAEAIEHRPEFLVVLGPYSSQRTLALSSFFNAVKLPILAPVVSVPEVWEQGEYIFSASDTNSARVKEVAKWLRLRGLKRAGVLIDQDSALSVAVANFFEESFTAAGGQVVAREKFIGISFDKSIERLREAQVDCVFFSDYRGTVLAHFAKNLQEAGLDIPVTSQIAPFTKDLVEAGGRYVEGVVTSGYFHNDSPRAKVREYSAKFKDLFELSPSHLDATAYDCCNIIFDAYRKGVRNRQMMRDYLDRVGAEPKTLGAMPNYEGVTGEFSLARKLDMRQVYLIEIRSGKYVLLDKDLK